MRIRRQELADDAAEWDSMHGGHPTALRLLAGVILDLYSACGECGGQGRVPCLCEPRHRCADGHTCDTCEGMRVTLGPAAEAAIAQDYENGGGLYWLADHLFGDGR